MQTAAASPFRPSFGGTFRYAARELTDPGIEAQDPPATPIQVDRLPPVLEEPVLEEEQRPGEDAAASPPGSPPAGESLDGAPLQVRALLGDPTAQTILGAMHYLGQEVSWDRVLARYWYRKAATNGNAVARFLLAGMLFLGEGGARDTEQARSWYHAAADQDYEHAHTLLWEFNELEESRVRELLLVLGNRALEDPGFVRRRDLAPREATPPPGADKQQAAAPPTASEPAPPAIQEAPGDVPLSARASLRQEALMAYETGITYERGLVVPQDYRLASEWFARAARKGHAPAQFKLGLAYLYGNGVEQDIAKSMHWMERAAWQRFNIAQRNLAIGFLLDNQPRSRIQAHAWLSIAAQQGNQADLRTLEELAGRMSEDELGQAQVLLRNLRNTLPESSSEGP